MASGNDAEITIGEVGQSALFVAGTGLVRVGGAWLVNPTAFEVLFGVLHL
jgi:hypothetical protein